MAAIILPKLAELRDRGITGNLIKDVAGYFLDSTKEMKEV